MLRSFGGRRGIGRGGSDEILQLMENIYRSDCVFGKKIHLKTITYL